MTIQAVESYRLAGGMLAEQWAVMDAWACSSSSAPSQGQAKAMGGEIGS